MLARLGLEPLSENFGEITVRIFFEIFLKKVLTPEIL